VARVVNIARGRTEDTLRWDDAFLERLIAVSLLRYLAIAHYGRGRGDYVDSEYPSHWRPAVEEAVAARHDAWVAVFALRDDQSDSSAIAADAVARLAPLLRETALALLTDFHPHQSLAPAR
jgi:hypothetical protein